MNHEGVTVAVNELRELFEQYLDAVWKRTKIAWSNDYTDLGAGEEFIAFAVERIVVTNGLSLQCHKYEGNFILEIHTKQGGGNQRAFELASYLCDEVIFQRILNSKLNTQHATIINAGIDSGKFRVNVILSFTYQ